MPSFVNHVFWVIYHDDSKIESMRLRLKTCFITEWYQLENFVNHLPLPNAINSKSCYLPVLSIVRTNPDFHIVISSLQTLSFKGNRAKNIVHKASEGIISNSLNASSSPFSI